MMEASSWCRRGPRRTGSLRLPILLLVGALVSPDARAQPAESAPIPIELNKLEPLPAAASGTATQAGCRVYIVIGNPDPEPITRLRLDLVLFGTDDIIARRVALDLAPLAPRKTIVRLFDLPNQPCDGVGRVLVNDVLGCQFGQREGSSGDEPASACLDRLQLTSRAKAKLMK